MPSRQERRSVSVGSTLFLIHSSAVEHHRPAIVEIDEIGVDARVLAVVRRPAVDAVFAQIGRALGLRPGLAGADLRVLGKSEFDHCWTSFLGDVGRPPKHAWESPPGTRAPGAPQAAPAASPERVRHSESRSPNRRRPCVRKSNGIAQLDVPVRAPRRGHGAWRARLHDQPWRHMRDVAAMQPWLQMKSSTGMQQLAGAFDQPLRGVARQHVSGCTRSTAATSAPASPGRDRGSEWQAGRLCDRCLRT